MSEASSVTLHLGAIARLTVCRPKVLNALDLPTLEGITRAVEQLQALRLEPEKCPRCLVIAGAGGRAFAAGADLAALRGDTGEAALRLSLAGQRAFNLVADFFAPTIAVVDGVALGGGLELALACDMVLASDDAVFAMPEVGLGLVPGFGGTQRLAARVGRHAALRLALLGERIDAQQAMRLGLVDDVVPKAELTKRAEDLSSFMASLSAEAVFACKRLIVDNVSLSCDAAMASERGAFASLVASAEAQQAIEKFLNRSKTPR